MWFFQHSALPAEMVLGFDNGLDTGIKMLTV